MSREIFGKARAAKRRERLLPNGEPRWIRAYDNGGRTMDRYTVVFTGKQGGYTILASEYPSHPQGVGQHVEGRWDDGLTFGTYNAEHAKHLRTVLGPRVKFSQLPEKVREWVLEEYLENWSLTSD